MNAGDDTRWIFKRGTLTQGRWESVVDERTPGWEHTGLRVAEICSGSALHLDETGIERIVIPLSGSFTVVHSYEGGHTMTTLHGRQSVFDGPTDVLYLSSMSTAIVEGNGRVAVATSPTDVVIPSRYIPATDVSVELRGSGTSSRQVHNFGTPENLEAARLIVCEVITPAGNWSSYPPHKHDENVPGHESQLEEIYYFESELTRERSGLNSPTDPFGLFSTYSSPAGSIDINAMVRTGDVALVPYGYHGPAVAAPGYDLYYLNVMAGPGSERVWQITDDPAQTWVRETWASHVIDTRLPYTTSKEA